MPPSTHNTHVRAFNSKESLYSGHGLWAGSRGYNSAISVGTQQDGIDVLQCLIAEDHIEVLCPWQSQQVHGLFLAALPAGTELGIRVATVSSPSSYIAHPQGLWGEAVVIDVGARSGQAYAIQTVHFHARCWEACQQVT